MKTFDFHTELSIPMPLDKVFPFFADANNLETITPGWLRFEIVTPTPIEMDVGTLIDYKLRYRGVPLKWQSEILEWDPPNRFVDRQVLGPYRKWIHQHLFEEREGYTLAIDQVEYAVIGGSLVNTLVVRRDVEQIFSYRKENLLEIFGKTG